MFEKLYKFVGKNIKSLVNRQDEPYTFRLQKSRVYYVKESLMKKSTNVRGGWAGHVWHAARARRGRGSAAGRPAAAAAHAHMPRPPAPPRATTTRPPPPQVARDKLISLGTCIGKLTHTGKFRLTIGALDILSQHAKYKVGGRAAQRGRARSAAWSWRPHAVHSRPHRAPPHAPCRAQIWVKPSNEMQFLYGNHVLKQGLGRITENTPAYTGVVVYSMSDVPLGFAVTGKSTEDCRTLEPAGIVAFHQADVGEWRRRKRERQRACGLIYAGRADERRACLLACLLAAARAGEYLRAEDEL